MFVEILGKGAVLFLQDKDRDYSRNRNAHTLYTSINAVFSCFLFLFSSLKGSCCYRNTKMYIWKSNFVWMQLFLVLLQVVPLLYRC